MRNVPLTAVIDFPHGQGQTDSVCQAAKLAWDAGADELDMVCNVGLLKAGEDTPFGTTSPKSSPASRSREGHRRARASDAELERVGQLVAELAPHI